MPAIKVERRSPAPSEAQDSRALFERVERLQRRLAGMVRAHQEGDSELRRQRAAGRRP